MDEIVTKLEELKHRLDILENDIHELREEKNRHQEHPYQGFIPQGCSGCSEGCSEKVTPF